MPTSTKKSAPGTPARSTKPAARKRAPQPIAYAAAYVDAYGGIVVAGGQERIEKGRAFAPSSRVLRLNAEVKGAKWKKRESLPQANDNLGVIPHVDGVVMGPFYDGLEGTYLIQK